MVIIILIISNNETKETVFLRSILMLFNAITKRLQIQR